MRSSAEMTAAIEFIRDFLKNFQNEDVEDLPAEVVAMLCAYTAMSPSTRRVFLQHVADVFCLDCGEQWPPVSAPDSGKCRCYG